MAIAIISGVTGQDGAFLAELLLSKQYTVIGLIPSGRPSDFFRLEYLGIRERITFQKINLLKDTKK